MVQRPSWDEYFMSITHQVAMRSTCMRRQVGAVLVKDKRILATGYNGSPRGLKHCGEVGCLREQQGIESGKHHELCRGVHAEQNAIVQAALYGVAIEGSVLYSTNQPCVQCAKMLMNAGVVEMNFSEAYADPLAESMLEEAGVRLRKLPAPGEDGTA